MTSPQDVVKVSKSGYNINNQSRWRWEEGLRCCRAVIHRGGMGGCGR